MKTFCKLLTLLCTAIYAGNAAGSELKISSLTYNNVEVEIGQGHEKELPLPRTNEIYDVYAGMDNQAGQKLYLDYIDSVYLVKWDKLRFTFHYMWDGAGKNMKSGYYLVPTGRIYAFSERGVTTIGGEASSNKHELLEILLLAGANVYFTLDMYDSYYYEEEEIPQTYGFGLQAGFALQMLNMISMKLLYYAGFNFEDPHLYLCCGYFYRMLDALTLYYDVGLDIQPQPADYLDYSLLIAVGLTLKFDLVGIEWPDNMLLDLSFQYEIDTAMIAPDPCICIRTGIRL